MELEEKGETSVEGGRTQATTGCAWKSQVNRCVKRRKKSNREEREA